jgi:hypothetical protein
LATALRPSSEWDVVQGVGCEGRALILNALDERKGGQDAFDDELRFGHVEQFVVVRSGRESQLVSAGAAGLDIPVASRPGET